MTNPEQAFLTALPLCIIFIGLPTWRGPIASACSVERDLMSARRAIALRTCPSAHGCSRTFRGRIRISECWACREIVPVYPLRWRDVLHLYNVAMAESARIWDHDSEDDENDEGWSGPVPFPGNRLAFRLLSQPRFNEEADVEEVVAWICAGWRCGQCIGIGEFRRDVCLQGDIW